MFLIGWLWQAQAPSTQPPDELTKLSLWLQAVQQHEPGRADPAITAASALTRTELQQVLATLETVRGVLRRMYPATSRLTNRHEIRVRGGRAIPALEIQRLLGMSDDEARRGDANRLLKRGALLHSDIGILAQDRATDTPGAAAGEPVTIRIADGRRNGSDQSTRHWEMARALLDLVTPDPSQDEWIAVWYRAAASHMRSHIQLGSGQPLLERARQLFPSDAEILFDRGCFNEASASPGVQAVLASITLPQKALPVSRLPATHWGLAVSLFRNALRIRPDWPEARVRLGRVLGLAGRHKDAVVELERALADTSDPTLIYDASLFLGDEEQTLGNPDRARASYERALKYRPRAQAPHLALSQLARRQGDRALALAEVRAVLALPSNDAGRYDPLWYYFGPQSQRADVLFAELRSLLAAEDARGRGESR